MTLQYRPKDGSDHRKYAPARDLAHCFPGLARMAVYGLGETSLEEWFKDYLKVCNVTNDDLVNVAKAVALAVKEFANPEHKNPMSALIASGFNDTPNVAQAAFCMKLGQATLGSYFVAIRDILSIDEGPPADLDDIAKAAEDIQKQFEERVKSK